MGKRIAVSQSNYLPWKGYFDLINSVDIFVIYDCVQYTKNDWRNRNQIIQNGKPQWLTIPVRVEHLSQRIDETRIADTRWAKKHWTSISQSYSKSPGFNLWGELIGDKLKEIASETLLSNVNSALLQRLCDIMGIKTQLISSNEFALPEDRNERLLTLCGELDADVYLSGPAAQVYLDEAAFTDNGIKVEWANYSGYSEYTQQTDVFTHNVSVIDLLFSVGDSFSKHMKSFQN